MRLLGSRNRSDFGNSEGWREKLLNHLQEIIVIGSVVAHLLIALVGNQTKYVTQTSESKEPSVSDFCSLFGEQLSSKKLHPKMLHSELFRQITKNNYKILEFTGSERVFRVYTKDDYCGIVLKDELGLRAFEASIKIDNSNPFYYSIIGLSEKFANGET